MAASLSALLPIGPASTSSERVGRQLRDLIGSGNIAAGERLPSENELARALQVSRPVVREALRGLAMMGIVESRQGGGCFVTDLQATRLMGPLDFYLRLSEHSMDEVFRARSVIDGALAHDAALNADEAQRAALVDLARMGFVLVSDATGFRVMDARFHALVAASARNSFLTAVSESVYSLGMDLRRRASATPGVLDRSALDHQAIAGAIAAGDAPAARAAMEAHVEHVRATTEQARQAMENGSREAP